MKYVKVESSQIAEVGYGEGLYGPETLALRFPPTKKQKAAGEPGSEYHYQNVTPEMHQEFMAAESIGSYFGRNIKPFQEKYPFTKVEAGPTAPTAEPPSAKNSAPAVGNDDTPSPGTALALIDDLKADFVFSPGNMLPIIDRIRNESLASVKGLTPATANEREAIKKAKTKVVRSRTFIQGLHDDYVRAEKKRLKTVDTVAGEIWDGFQVIERELLDVTGVTAWEQEEETRKAQLTARVKFIVDMGQTTLYNGIPDLEDAIASVESFDVSTMQEFKVSAESAIAASLRVLKQELERRKAAEMMREELESLRAADAKRQDDERIAAAAKKLADEQVQAAVEKAREETRIELTTSPAPTMEEIADRPQPFVYKEAPAVSHSMLHEQRINAQAVAAFMGLCGYTRLQAIAGLTAITKRLIPHVSITY